MNKISGPIFVGAPSATGKTTLLKTLRDKGLYEVDDLDYERLRVMYDRDERRIREHMLTKRTEKRVYEHTCECALLYPIVHEYMDALSSGEKRMSRALMCEISQRVMRRLYKLQSNNDRRVVVVIDITKAYRDRYFERLENQYNGIDYDNIDYLFVQLAAFEAFFGLTLPPMYVGSNEDLGSSWVRIVVVADKEAHDYLLGGGNDLKEPGFEVFGLPDAHGVINSLRDSIVDNRLMGIPATTTIDELMLKPRQLMEKREIRLVERFDPEYFAEYVLREPGGPQYYMELKEMTPERKAAWGGRQYTMAELSAMVAEREALDRLEADAAERARRAAAEPPKVPGVYPPMDAKTYMEVEMRKLRERLRAKQQEMEEKTRAEKDRLGLENVCEKKSSSSSPSSKKQKKGGGRHRDRKTLTRGARVTTTADESNITQAIGTLVIEENEKLERGTMTIDIDIDDDDDVDNVGDDSGVATAATAAGSSGSR